MKLFGLIQLTMRLFGVAKPKEIVMAKQDIVSAAIAQVQAGEQQVLSDAVGAAVDAAYAEQKASDGTVTTPSDQATIDALTAQVADLQGKLDASVAQDAADVKTGQDALAALQVSFDKMSADKAVEDGVIAGLQAAKDSLAAVLASLSAIGQPAPAPVDPAPAA